MVNDEEKQLKQIVKLINYFDSKLTVLEDRLGISPITIKTKDQLIDNIKSWKGTPTKDGIAVLNFTIKIPPGKSEDLDWSGVSPGTVNDAFKTLLQNSNGKITGLHLSSWDVSNVTDITNMFYNLTTLETVNLSGWEVENIALMIGLFNGCTNLTTIYGIGGFNVGNVESFEGMFKGCSNLNFGKNKDDNDTTPWNMGKKPLRSTAGMFQDCEKLTNIDFLMKLKSKYTDRGGMNMRAMFSGCYNLDDKYMSKITSNWGKNVKTHIKAIEKIKDISYMFSQCKALNSIKFMKNFKDIISKDLNANSAFEGCIALTEVDLSFFSLPPQKNSNLQLEELPPQKNSNLQLEELFLGCSALNTIIPINNSIYLSASMFQDCTSLTTVDLTIYPADNDLSEVFKGCNKLNSVTLSSPKSGNPIPIKSLRQIFQGCTALNKVDLSGLGDFSQVTTMESMFEGCSNLSTLIFPNTPTKSLINMSSMFKDCESLTSVPLFSMSQGVFINVNSIDKMLYGCENLNFNFNIGVSRIRFPSVSKSPKDFCTNAPNVKNATYGPSPGTPINCSSPSSP